VGILAGFPTKALWAKRRFSGFGLLGRRPDLAALVLILVFGAFANALGMVGPFLDWQDSLRRALRLRSPFFVTSAFYILALIVMPIFAVGAAGVLSRRWGRLEESLLEVVTRFSFALVPLGFAMWLAHYSFHLLTSYAGVVPAVHRFVADLGCRALGAPDWSCACCMPAADWVPRMEIVALDVGLLMTLYAAFRIARTQAKKTSQALKAFFPWAMLAFCLFALGVWIVLQPMQMRGTMLAAG
jgi:hypothetical protein